VKTILLIDHKVGYLATRMLCYILSPYIEIERKSHFLFQQDYQPDNKYIMTIRHPKEIIISGYLYHKRLTIEKGSKVCEEPWAQGVRGWYYENGVNFKDGMYVAGIYTQDLIVKHANYLDMASNFSDPISYTDKLKSLPTEEGIIYEMKSVARLTIDGMYQLEHYLKPNTFTLKLEDLIFDHDNTVMKLCRFLDIDNIHLSKIIEQSREHNLLVLKSKSIDSPHATNKKVKRNRYKDHWNDNIESEFLSIYPKDILSKFAYT